MLVTAITTLLALIAAIVPWILDYFYLRSWIRTYVTLKTNNTDKTDLVIASEDASEFTQAVDKLMKPDNRSFA